MSMLPKSLYFLSSCFILFGCSRSTTPPQSEATIIQPEQTSPEMVLIKAGTYEMGSPESEPNRDKDEPLTKVILARDFYLGKYEVTVAQYRSFIDSTGYKTENERDGKDFDWSKPFQDLVQSESEPVLAVSWNDAVAYCDWLSKRTGESYRLPTEREWEYACRAGTKTAFHFGATLAKNDANFSNYQGDTAGSAILTAKGLGTKKV